ncbi:hypothetical protein [Sphingomonas nostoxanthinifaciens]|uniref:hypothetical protein n=1 Tax=Sphingomonas nostoxanthinifaciens TaxID=2872652 RepID=UPI001CC211A5|nr:hypothetical protein [Sphingomonas nostoxanthinifaciens]UAK24126.1 hypothetical protein K8P63_17620 [Sphingomonas nostoxanthinifaciens]
MRLLSKLLVAGAGVAAIAGVALAAERDAHVLNVVLPDGSVERIHYVGNVAPRVMVTPVAAPTPVAAFDEGDPFAMFDRIAAEMDARSDAMLRQALAVQAAAPVAGAQLDHAALAQQPAGTVSYSFTSYSSSNGTCQQSVQVTSFAPGEAPKVARQSSGDCSAVNTTKAIPAVQEAPAAPAAPVLTKAKYDVPATPAKPRQTI